MNFKFPIPVLVATLAFSSAITFQNEVQAQPQKKMATVFRCVRSGQAYATIAQRGNERSAPMITWERYVSAGYTPQQRCQIVSQKLTRAVAQNGGRLSNLLLTIGVVNGETVICYVNSGARCGINNTLFTLSPEGAKDPGAVLANLLRFGQRGSYTVIRENANTGGYKEAVDAVDMEEAVEKAFAASDNPADPDRNSPVE